MTDIEKIKGFIILQDLQLKGFKQQLNAEGCCAMMHLQKEFEGTEGKDILSLIDRLFEHNKLLLRQTVI